MTHRRIVKLGLLSIFLMLSGVFIAFFGLSTAHALSEEQSERVRQQCTTAQVTMQRVQQSDIATRINTGRYYDSLVTNLMAPMNSRAALNRLAIAPRLAEITADLEDALARFRTHYSKYTDALTGAIRMRCEQNPEDFSQRVSTVRDLRSQVAESVQELKDVTKMYEKEIEDYKKATFTDESN